MTRTAGPRCAHGFEPWSGPARRVPGRSPGSMARWSQPLGWNRRAAGAAERPRVLCTGPRDWLDPALPPVWLSRLLSLIRRTPRLEWVLPVVRPWHWEDRMRAVLRHGLSPATARWLSAWLSGESVPAHVRVGTLVRNQEEADAGVPWLLSIPAASRFVLCAGMTGRIDLSALTRREDGGAIHHVLCGAGCPPEWTASLQTQCSAAGIPFSNITP